MYITQLDLESVRTFTSAQLRFVHLDADFRSPLAEKGPKDKRLPRPRLTNVNLLLGDNGSGKSTVLRTIALAAMGPAARSSGLRDPGLIRRLNGSSSRDH